MPNGSRGRPQDDGSSTLVRTTRPNGVGEARERQAAGGVKRSAPPCPSSAVMSAERRALRRERRRSHRDERGAERGRRGRPACCAVFAAT